MRACFLLFTCCVLATFAQTQYFLGDVGLSCSETCTAHGMNCNPHIVTNDTTEIFTELGVTCTPNSLPWWAHNQPGYVSGSPDPNHGECLGYVDVPGGVLCSGSYPTMQRVCRCDEPSTGQTLFGTGLSGGQITTDEQFIFQHFLAPGDTGAMTHFWFTMANPNGDGVIVSYYVDGEETPSIQFNPALACGVGGNDTQAAWGNSWFGKGANDYAYFWDFPIPFQKSIVVTARHESGSFGSFYMIVRGVTNPELQFGRVTLPSNVKLNLFKTEGVFQPLEWITIANVSSGNSGLTFMHTLSVESQNLNFLEGCYHVYSTADQEFPGVLISTGTEDYFDSAWYFNAGEFHLPTAGFTHYSTTNGIQLSAYRVHEADALTFNDGFRFVWRNGDAVDAAGIKCMMETGGNVVGSPSASYVISYVWVYSWEN